MLTYQESKIFEKWMLIISKLRNNEKVEITQYIYFVWINVKLTINFSAILPILYDIFFLIYLKQKYQYYL